MLQIVLFGIFHVQLEQTPLAEIRLNSANRLLALLTLHAGRALQNDWLAETLWPETESLDSLRHSIQSLRRAFGPEAWRVRSANNTVTIDLDGAQVDTSAFEAALQRGDVTSLSAAIRLYKGPLLKDWNDAWILPERKERQERYLDALIALADFACKASRPLEAARYLAKIVEGRPTWEQGWERLTEALIQADARLEALDVVQRYQEYLQRQSKKHNVELALPPPIRELLRSLHSASAQFPPHATADSAEDEPLGGAMPLNSPYYMARLEDEDVQTAIRQQTSVVLLKGPRQIGKSSLLARLLHTARQNGSQVVFTDWQKLASEDLATSDAFFRAMAQNVTQQLSLDTEAEASFHPRRSPSANFERFLRDQVFSVVRAPLVWGIDEADRLFACPFRDNVFGLFRSWHNERAYDPEGPWHRVTLALAYATDVHLFIRDLNQSPFNVGTRVTLRDFTPEQVAELNRRYGNPLTSPEAAARLYALVGGHPYLVRCCLLEMKRRSLSVADMESEAQRDEGLFSDHLDRLLVALLTEEESAETVRSVLRGETPASRESVVRVCASGILVRDEERLRPRCHLYEAFLRRHLL